MKIKVTQQHVDDGQWTNPLHSPIALALKEAGFVSVLVFRDKIHIGTHKIPFTEHLRLSVTDQKPFEFEIKLPLSLRIKNFVTGTKVGEDRYRYDA